MKKDSINNRMKVNYEDRTRYYLPRRTNTIIRCDGKSFHTYTKNFEKPFDSNLMEVMDETALELCKNIQGAVMAYVQSDEISLVLQDYDKLSTDAWFDGNIQKMSSISASIATGYFNRIVAKKPNLKNDNLAFFDSRVFTIPERTEVINYFIARQQDAVRNSISMVAQSLYSHKELYKKSANEMQEMSWKKGINWNDLDAGKKRGRMVVKEPIDKRLNNDVGKSLIEKGDERVFMKQGRYLMKVDGWKIRNAADFNKKKDHLKIYLDLRKNIDLF